ncbi:uncharacterized protein LOC142635089 [Castanea sativa]|uniref:uncharacterized protein LOC142635089 n=1 Tax=Castanea sativa TaxID=21020 RepID=UPI003F653A36
MKQNEELKRRAHPEGSNPPHHRRSHSRHDEEASSPKNSKGRYATEYTGQSMYDNDLMMKSLRKELDEVKNAMKGKTVMNLDGMLKQTDSPFTTVGAARVWFSKLPASSIANFQQLSDSFVHHFIGGQRHKRPTSYLLIVRQQEGESLRDYVKLFNKVVLEIDEANDQVIMTTFQVGLNNPDLIFSLGKTPPTSMTDLLFKAQKYMNGEDALIAKGLTRKWKKEELGDSQGKKKDHKDSYTETKTSKSSFDTPKKKMNFTLLVMPANKILMQIKDEPKLKWPKPLSTSSRKRDPKKYCRFHKDHSHYTDECRDLKEQIEKLI